MKRISVLASAILMACSLTAAPAAADTGPTLSVNPDLSSAYMVLDDGKIMTMDAATQTFTLRTAQGQTATVSFQQVAQLETSIPTEQQALVNEWIAMLDNPSNTFTLTDSHQPTLAVSQGGLEPPPGEWKIEGVPGGGSHSTFMTGDEFGASTQSFPSGPGDGDCLLVPCSCRTGSCWPGRPWGSGGGMEYSVDGGRSGPGEQSKRRQECEADHEAAFIAQQGASCALLGSLGWATGVAMGTAAVTCGAAGATSGAALVPCASSFASFVGAAMSYISARQTCRSHYHGSGTACVGL